MVTLGTDNPFIDSSVAVVCCHEHLTTSVLLPNHVYVAELIKSYDPNYIVVFLGSEAVTAAAGGAAVRLPSVYNPAIYMSLYMLYSILLLWFLKIS